jgi:hypothetical protein
MWGIFIGTLVMRVGVACVAFGLLGGCGTYVPSLAEGGDSQNSLRLEAAIARSIHCELRNAVIDVFVEDSQQTPHLADFLQSWAVQMTLTLTIDEKTVLNPVISMSFMGTNFTLGAFGSASTHATRLDKFNYYYPVQELLKSGKCPDGVDEQASLPHGSGSLLIRSDLKTKEWLLSQFANKWLGNFPKDDFKHNTNAFQHEVTFVVDTGAGVTPGAKLATVNLMPSGTFLSADRMRTHDLNLVFGPASEDEKKNQRLSDTGQALFLSSQISSAIQNGLLRGQVAP